MNINTLRHPKEKLYRTTCMIVGGLAWLILLLSTAFLILIFLIPIGIVLWVSEKFFQASIYGNSVMVSENQYSKVHSLIKDTANNLQLTYIPTTFVVNSDGMINAVAIKFLSKKYVLLFSSLVDIFWDDENQEKLNVIIAHELAHHAAGHVNFWANLLMKPAMFIPFLGSAYSRSCELTADRIAASYINNESACVDSLITLASGSRELVTQTDKEAFVHQETMVPGFFGFMQEILSSHLRMTRRIIAIHKFYNEVDPKSRTIDS